MTDDWEILPNRLWQGRWREEIPCYGAIISMVARGRPRGCSHYFEYPIRDPMWDHEMTADWHDRVESAVDMTLQQLEQGRRVLVVCAAGANRSGIVVALTLRELFRWTGARVLRETRSRHPGALYNVNLQAYLETLSVPEEI